MLQEDLPRVERLQLMLHENLLYATCYATPLRDEVEVHENAIKERGQYTAILTEQAWSIKVYYIAKEFHLTTENLKRVGWGSILFARLTNQNTEFASSCPLIEPTI